MKRIYSYLIILAAALSLNGCSDSDFADIYTNPSKVTKAGVDKLMTGTFYVGREYTFNAYWRIWTWDNNIIGTYAQTISCIRDNGQMYSGTNGEAYAKDRWDNFYRTLTQFRVLEDVYNALPADQQPMYSIYKDLAEVFVYDHLSQVVDIWGDIPFTGASTLYLTGDLTASRPAYDKAADIYTIMLDRLGVISTSIANASESKGLTNQDFINNGDLDKWERYANSLRLRLAVRVAAQGALAQKGKTVVAEILNGNKKLVDSFNNTIALPSNNADTGAFFNPDDLRTGYNEHTTYSNASIYMLNALNATTGTPDPRLPFLYSKNAAGVYKGVDRVNSSYAEISTNVNKVPAERVYSRIDSTTMGYNTKFFSPIMMAAEVDFLRAEAYQQGWATGNAQAAYVAGMKNAATFVFEENKISPSTDGYKPAGGVYPTDAEVEAYATTAWTAASDKLKEIIKQRWLSLGYFQSTQAWSEVRRMGYDYLGFGYPTDSQAQVLKNVPNRIKYPATERDYNTENYQNQVQSMPNGDDYYTKVFWAK